MTGSLRERSLRAPFGSLGTAAGEATVVKRLLFGRRHDHQGVGLHKSFRRKTEPTMTTGMGTATCNFQRTSAQTRRTKARLTYKLDFTGRATESRPNFATWGMLFGIRNGWRRRRPGHRHRRAGDGAALIDGRTPRANMNYGVAQFVANLRDRSVTPHIAIDGHFSKTGVPR